MPNESDQCRKSYGTRRTFVGINPLFMGTVEGWRRGKRVTFQDFEGTRRSLGDMEAYSQVGEDCGWQSGEDGGWVCTPVFDWVPIATPVEEYEGG